MVLSLGLFGNLHCGGSSTSTEGDGDGDGDTGGTTGGDADGAGGTFGAGGTATEDPPDFMCTHQPNQALDACDSDCPITLDALVTCGTSSFLGLPEVVTTPDGEGVQFLVAWQRNAFEAIHGLLESGGNVSVTTLSTSPVGYQNNWRLAGFDPMTGALDLLRTESNDTFFVSSPWTTGTPTWTEAMSAAWNLRGIERDEAGTLHLVAHEEAGDAQTYAFGTAAGGFTQQDPGWSADAWTVGLSRDAAIVSFRGQMSGSSILVAEPAGSAVQTLTDLGETIGDILPARGVVTEPSAPDFVVLATADTFSRVAPPAGSGLQTVDLPLAQRPTSACPTDACEGECSWEGDYSGGMSIARTTDGRVWVANLAIHEDTTTVSRVITSEDAYICGAEYTRDESTAEVELYELDLSGKTWTRVLSVPTNDLAPVPLNIDNYMFNYGDEGMSLTPSGTELVLTTPIANELRNEQTFWTLRVDTMLIP